MNKLLECTEGPCSIRPNNGGRYTLLDQKSSDPSSAESLANARLFANASDHALLLWAVTRGLVDAGDGHTSISGLDGLVSTANYETPDDPFGCPLLTPDLRQALLDLMREESKG